jgi:glutamine amidotransferase
VNGPLIAVCDYGIGNLRSAQKALATLGADARLTSDPGLIADAAAVVLPGVGAFGACMAALRASGLEAPVRDAVASDRPFLGICVGMQMLFTGSEEDPTARGLGVLPGTVRWLSDRVKRPQMQWNRVDVVDPADPMFAGLGERPWFYFVHSLHGVPDDSSTVAATCNYGGTVNAAFRAGNVFATQFHPEKSATAGLGLLGNFVAGVGALT